MKQINSLPVEEFLDKARIAIKSNQKTLTLSIKEVTDLQNSLSIIMTRLTGYLDNTAQNPPVEVIKVNMDGGKF